MKDWPHLAAKSWVLSQLGDMFSTILCVLYVPGLIIFKLFAAGFIYLLPRFNAADTIKLSKFIFGISFVTWLAVLSNVIGFLYFTRR